MTSWMLLVMVGTFFRVQHPHTVIALPTHNHVRPFLPLSHRSSGLHLLRYDSSGEADHRYISRLYLVDDASRVASDHDNNDSDGKKKNSNRSWKPQNLPYHKPANEDKEFLRPGIHYYMDKLVSASDERDWWKFVKSLKSLAMEPNNAQCIPQLIPLLDKVEVKKLDGSLTADLVWSLGRLNFAVTHTEQKPLLMSLMYRFCELEEMSSREVTTSLVGFGKLRFRWSYLSAEMHQSIIQAVGSIVELLNDREVGNILHSFSKLGVPWSVFPESVANGLLESMVRVSKRLVSQQGSMVIYSLGLMGVSLDDVTPQIRDHLYNIAMAVLEESKVHIHQSVTQQASNVIYGLAKMGARYKQLPTFMITGISDGIINAMGYMNEQEVANTIYSLGIMGAKWSDLPTTLQDVICKTTVIRVGQMIPQGLSNILYGFGLMASQWGEMSVSYRQAIHAAIIKNFGSSQTKAEAARPLEELTTIPAGIRPPVKYPHMLGSSQAVANVIYSLGVSGAEWSSFPDMVQKALVDGIVEWGPRLSSQELSNLCYGLGLMRADYHQLPRRATKTLEDNYSRVKLIMNEQEVCSTLHGIAKMNAGWLTIGEEVRRTILISIASLTSVGALCLACTIYSLGLMGATWEELPDKIKESFMQSAMQRRMQDQTISNVVYGLSLLNVEMNGLEPEFLAVLLDNIAQPDAFGSDISQHISNTIWGLAKMDASWQFIPGKNLEAALVRCAPQLCAQETSNTLYGLAVMDCPWSSLDVETKEAVYDSLQRTITLMTNQETANVMYSIALMTYDADYQTSPPTSLNETEHELFVRSQRALMSMHQLVLQNFNKIHPDEYEKENYDQYAMYFEMMRAIPVCDTLVKEVLGREPRTSGPCAGIPSRLHAKTILAMMRNLESLAKGPFDVYHEFSGLHGVFPIDAAVYYQNKLVAFVEIDGEFHYKQLGQVLRRKDRMKEFLYKRHYPTIPLFRIRSDQCTVIGVRRAGRELAVWISTLVLGAQVVSTMRRDDDDASSNALMDSLLDLEQEEHYEKPMDKTSRPLASWKASIESNAIGDTSLSLPPSSTSPSPLPPKNANKNKSTVKNKSKDDDDDDCSDCDLVAKEHTITQVKQARVALPPIMITSSQELQTLESPSLPENNNIDNATPPTPKVRVTRTRKPKASTTVTMDNNVVSPDLTSPPLTVPKKTTTRSNGGGKKKKASDQPQNSPVVDIPQS